MTFVVAFHKACGAIAKPTLSAQVDGSLMRSKKVAERGVELFRVGFSCSGP
jgi:hypothetical protein